MSKTQARQIRFSTIDMDSAGKAEMSRGRSVSSFAAAGFRTEGCLRAGARFTVFAVLAEALGCRGSLVTGLDGDFVFPGGMGLPLFRISRDSDESTERTALRVRRFGFFVSPSPVVRKYPLHTADTCVNVLLTAASSCRMRIPDDGDRHSELMPITITN